MAKQQRGAPPRSVKKKATARKGAAPRSARGPATKVKGRPAARPAARRTATKPAAKPVKLLKPGKAAKAPVAPVQPAAPAPPPVAPRKPGFYEAVAIYERGVQALQRHDYVTGRRTVPDGHRQVPEERELVERARVFVRVCERETARQAPPPETARDFVYAATVALNAGDHAGALGHLQRAISADDEDDHAHYTMAAALSLRGRSEEAIRHLQRSIALNPENRSQARQDPDLDSIRQLPGFRMALETAPAQRRKAVAARRR